MYEQADHLEIDSGDATRGGIYRGILAGNFDPFIGLNAPVAGRVPTYRNGVPTGTTASYDNFAAAQRVSYVGHSYSYSRDFLVDGKVNGNLFPGLCQGGLAFNIGGEYRQSRTNNVPDPVFAANSTGRSQRISPSICN